MGLESIGKKVAIGSTVLRGLGHLFSTEIFQILGGYGILGGLGAIGISKGINHITKKTSKSISNALS